MPIVQLETQRNCETQNASWYLAMAQNRRQPCGKTKEGAEAVLVRLSSEVRSGGLNVNHLVSGVLRSVSSG